MIWGVRAVALAAVVGLYLLVFRNLGGYWPLAGMAFCIALYVGVMTVLERSGLHIR